MRKAVNGKDHFYPVISIQLADKEKIEEVARLMHSKIYDVPRREPTHNQYYRTAITGQNAVDTMGKLRPLMSPERQEKIDPILKAWASRLPMHPGPSSEQAREQAAHKARDDRGRFQGRER